MAMRLRLVDDVLIALCAARSVAVDGDVYVDDDEHSGVIYYFSNKFNSMLELDLVSDDKYRYTEAQMISKYSLAQYLAFEQKFLRDWAYESDYDYFFDEDIAKMVEEQESNNENRTWWDVQYGQGTWTIEV